MPDGRIIVAVQSTLDIDAKSKKKALFTRLVSFDPASGKTAMYGYPIDSAAYSKNSDAKIGDIVALDIRIGSIAMVRVLLDAMKPVEEDDE
ncbi:hypothetical protein BMT56_19675 [Escherichia coli]|nr:hypothetical protein BMT56_19675 [Escherichia coli]